MKLDANRLAASFALTAVGSWLVCSLLVAMMPMLMVAVTKHMLHAEMIDFTWHLTGSGFLLGLISWVAWAAVAGWLIAQTYNKLGGSTEA